MRRRRTLILRGDKARRARAILRQTGSNSGVRKAVQARRRASARPGPAWARLWFLRLGMTGASSKPAVALRIQARGMQSDLSGTTPLLGDETASQSVSPGTIEKVPPSARAKGEAQLTRSI